jgi:hypothetical protein
MYLGYLVCNDQVFWNITVFFPTSLGIYGPCVWLKLVNCLVICISVRFKTLLCKESQFCMCQFNGICAVLSVKVADFGRIVYGASSCKPSSNCPSVV